MPTNPQTQTAPQKVKRSKWFWTVMILASVGLYLGYRAWAGKMIESRSGSFTIWPYIAVIIALGLLYKFMKKRGWKGSNLDWKVGLTVVGLIVSIILIVGLVLYVRDVYRLRAREEAGRKDLAVAVREYTAVVKQTGIPIKLLTDTLITAPPGGTGYLTLPPGHRSWIRVGNVSYAVCYKDLNGGTTTVEYPKEEMGTYKPIPPFRQIQFFSREKHPVQIIIKAM